MSVTDVLMGSFAAAAVVFVSSRLLHVRVKARTHVTFRDLHAISQEAHALIGEQLRATAEGDPAALRTALAGVLPMVRGIAARHGQTLDDDVLRIMVASSIAAHHLATRAAAETACDEALRDLEGAA